MEHWFVVHTQPSGEQKALQHLERQSLTAYLPRYLKRRRHARRTDWVPRPLFPRYLFVRFDPDRARWRAVNSTVGVSHLVCNGNLPVPLPDGIVEDIRARENDRGLIAFNPSEQFRAGQAVQIASNAFDACIGLFEAVCDNERVTVLLNLLGRQVRVNVPAESLSAVN